MHFACKDRRRLLRANGAALAIPVHSREKKCPAAGCFDSRQFRLKCMQIGLPLIAGTTPALPS
jgi:hypothetical protein